MATDGLLRLTGATFPVTPNPPAGKFYVGVDASNGHFKVQDSTGAVFDYNAMVADAIVDGVTTVAPSQNAVFDALALKSDVGHTHVAADVTDFSAAADARITLQKGAANGLATLDAGSKIPSAQLPSFVDDVLEYANLGAFPGTGETGKIYVALDTEKIWRWSGSVYIEISPSPGTTDDVPEGSINLYYTDARARAAISVNSPLQYNSGTGVVSIPVATSSVDGYLSQTDWSTFNNKQPAGNYITDLTGDVTASGPGSAPATLASVGTAGTYVKVTTDAKGRVIAGVAGPQAIADGGTGQTTANAAFNALSPMTTAEDIIVYRGGVAIRLPKGADNTALQVVAGVLTYVATPSPYSVASINSNTSATSGTTYLCDTSGGAFNLTLPTPANGAFIIIKDSTGSFQSNNLSLLQNGSEEIEGLAATKLFQTNWGSWSIFSDGTDWFMGPF